MGAKRRGRFGCSSLFALVWACGQPDLGGLDGISDAGADRGPSPTRDAGAPSHDAGAAGGHGASDAGDAGDRNHPNEIVIQLNGAVQKGPFIVGSTTTVANLDANAKPTGSVFSTSTHDNLGHFELEFAATGWVSIESTGYYYNEVTGSLAVSPLTLRSLYAVREAGPQSAFVNVVTHLTFDRTRQLIAAGVTFEGARAQAEQELLDGLGIAPPSFSPGADGAAMNLLGGDVDANAYLFAVSTVLAQAARATSPAAPDAALQELLNQISLDLATTGGVDATRRARVAEAMAAVDTAAVEAAFTARLVALGSTAPVPDLDRILDQDGDARVNVGDNCPYAPNPLQTDLDEDLVGDVCDDDRDGDGSSDDSDALPEDATEWSDADGIADAIDNCRGIDNADQLDTDGDGFGDACDDDRDGDDAPNSTDSLPDSAAEWSDTDGIADHADNCLGLDNPAQLDLDQDGEGDACDDDDDGDGAPDSVDNCPTRANPGQTDLDADGYGNICDDDDDGDGAPDSVDNCPTRANPAQNDLDGDGYGNACDDDRDGDGTLNGADRRPDDANEWSDTDGVADSIDNCLGVNNLSQSDRDQDWAGDACDEDADGDGALDSVDNCLANFNPTQSDSDGDGSGDTCDSNAHIPEVSVSIHQEHVFSGSSVSCSYTYADADGDADRSLIEWRLNGVKVADGSTYQIPLARRGRSLECVVTPSDGTNTGSPVVDTRIVENTVPTMPSGSVTPEGLADDGDDLRCPVATDPDRDPLTYTYSWARDGVSTDETTGTVSAALTLPGERWSCTATASDAESTSAPGTAETYVVTFVPGAGNSSRWTAAGSPYYLTGLTQDPFVPTGPLYIGRNSTLIVEAGTTIFSSGNRKAIEVAGRFEVIGSEEAPVVIENVHIGAAPFDGFSTAPSAFVFRHAQLWGSSIRAVAVNTSLQLEDCVLGQLQGSGGKVEFSMNDSSDVTHATSSIQRNIFLRNGGLRIATARADVSVFNNVFVEDESVSITIGTSFAHVHHNSLLTIDRVVASGCFDFTNNYWGGVADGDVPQRLDCPSAPYLPTLAAPHPDTPDITPWLP
jgi:hypothetical protein